MFGGPNTYSQDIWKTRVIIFQTDCQNHRDSDARHLTLSLPWTSFHPWIASGGGPNGWKISKFHRDHSVCRLGIPPKFVVWIRGISPKLGGGFKYLLFSSLFGEDSHFDSHFSDGLKPPTRKCSKHSGWGIIVERFAQKNGQWPVSQVLFTRKCLRI